MQLSDMSDVRSIPAEFTLRALNRQPAKVLAACDRIGVVRIRSRKGRSYELRAEPAAPASDPQIPNFAARRKALGMKKMTHQQETALDRLIAGE